MKYVFDFVYDLITINSFQRYSTSAVRKVILTYLSVTILQLMYCCTIPHLLYLRCLCS